MLGSKWTTTFVFVFCLFTLLITGSTSQDIDDEIDNIGSGDDTGSVVENINDIVDRMLPDVAQQIQRWDMDPLPVGNLHSRDLSDCIVEGLATIHRAGNCYFTSANQRKALLQAHIGFNEITGNCQFAKRVFLYMYRGTIRMGMQNATTFVRISQVMDPDAHPALEYLDVRVPMGMELRASGSGTVRFVVNALQIFYRRRMRQLVEHVLREKVQEIVMEYLKRITLEDITNAINGQSHLLLFNNTLDL